MSEGVSLKLNHKMVLLLVFLLLLSWHESCYSQLYNVKDPVLINKQGDALLPEISSSGSPQPYLPILAPSPLASFTNSTAPKGKTIRTLCVKLQCLRKLDDHDFN